MPVRALTLAILLLVPTSVGAQGEATADYVVLAGSDALLEAVEPLVRHRRAEGLKVQAEARPVQHPEQAIAWIARRQPTYVLLVGDVASVPQVDVVHPGKDESVSTDRPYGDFDGDGYPEAAVGRIPFDDPARVRALAERIVAYERDLDGGLWRKELALVAGEARYSPAIDAVIEQLFARVVAEGVAPGYDVDLTYANPRSAYCYPPERFAERVARRVSEGPLVLAYVGHGNARSVDSLTVEDAASGETVRHDVLDARRAGQLAARPGARAPVMLAIACWTGRYEDRQSCIGEELLAAPGGPVAFFGATRISHPVHNALLAKELVRELFATTGEVRLGPALDRARRAMAEGRPGTPDQVRLQILMMARAFVGEGELKVEMPRHVDMYNLLGDPALRLARPQDAVTLDGSQEPVPAGSGHVARGRLDAAYRYVTVTLETERTGSARPEGREGETPLERYARANDKVLATQIVPVARDGSFETAPFLLPKRPGRYLIKAFAQAEGRCALGGTVLRAR